MRLDDFRYLITPTRNPQPGWEQACHQAFELWREVWSNTFLELEGSSTLYSDEFTRQTMAGTIFMGSQCVALGLFQEVDFSAPSAWMDSYFKVWPSEAIELLIRDGKRVFVGSNITVGSAYRGKLEGGYQLKHLISSLMVRTFLNSDYDAMTGTMRCNKGMHHEAHRLGASSLRSEIRHHGVEVELVAFYRRELSRPGALQLDLATESLWARRADFRRTGESLKQAA